MYKGLLNDRSVLACRSTEYCAGVSSRAHSSSLCVTCQTWDTRSAGRGGSDHHLNALTAGQSCGKTSACQCFTSVMNCLQLGSMLRDCRHHIAAQSAPR